MLQCLLRTSIRSFSTEKVDPVKVARVLAVAHHKDKALPFDPVTASDEQLLSYSTLYGLEREALSTQDRLVRFGRKALRQIKDNRLPEGSRFRDTVPEELLDAATPSDAAIVRWFADLVIDSATYFETPALAEYKKLRFQNDVHRVRLLKWFGTQAETKSAVLTDAPLSELVNLRKSVEDIRKHAAIVQQMLADKLCDEALIKEHGTTLASIRTLRNKLRGDKAAVGLRRANLIRALTEANVSFSMTATNEELETLYLPIKTAKEEKLAREKLNRWFFNSGKHRVGLESVDYTSGNVSVAELESIKADWVAKDKTQRAEAAHTKLVDQARNFAKKMHDKGKLTEFDYRETGDEKLIEWYAQKKIKQ